MYNNKKVLVSDSHLVYKMESISNDTLIYFNSFYLSPTSLGKVLSADFNFSSLSLEGVNLNIYKYLND